jgi:lysophospholipase L1-like esterase
MRIPGILNSTRQLASVLIGTLGTILLLESGGLVVWAKRLEIGPGRSAAVHAALAIHQHLQPLGVENLRRDILVSLQKTGWSDDAAPIAPLNPGILSALNANLAGFPAACIPARNISIPAPTVPAMLVVSLPQKIALKPLPPLEAGRPRIVALVGDSMMAVGLSSVLLHDSAQNKNLQIVKAFRSGTGLARPDVFDWMSEYPGMIGDARPDTVIVAIGANDGQDFLDGDKPLKFGTDTWISVYQRRTEQFLAMLTGNGAHVVWIALPPMKAAGYNSRIDLINRISLSVVSANPHAVWWNPAPYIGDDKGQYREFVEQPDGKVQRLRAPDGIHMSLEGAELLSPSLLSWLNAAPMAAVSQAATTASQPMGPTTLAVTPSVRN